MLPPLPMIQAAPPHVFRNPAVLLSKYGYTSVEKLREATIKDLTKIGLKKKNAQMIITESEEFSEWQVLNTDDQSMRI